MRSGRLRDFENSDQFLPIDRIPKYEFVDDVELHPSSVGKAKTDEIVVAAVEHGNNTVLRKIDMQKV